METGEKPELQQLIDDANQSLEEAGTPSHEVSVVIPHREFASGSLGITLAGGADYETKEITGMKNNKVDSEESLESGGNGTSVNPWENDVAIRCLLEQMDPKLLYSIRLVSPKFNSLACAKIRSFVEPQIKIRTYNDKDNAGIERQWFYDLIENRNPQESTDVYFPSFVFLRSSPDDDSEIERFYNLIENKTDDLPFGNLSISVSSPFSSKVLTCLGHGLRNLHLTLPGASVSESDCLSWACELFRVAKNLEALSLSADVTDVIFSTPNAFKELYRAESDDFLPNLKKLTLQGRESPTKSDWDSTNVLEFFKRMPYLESLYTYEQFEEKNMTILLTSLPIMNLRVITFFENYLSEENINALTKSGLSLRELIFFQVDLKSSPHDFEQLLKSQAHSLEVLSFIQRDQDPEILGQILGFPVMRKLKTLVLLHNYTNIYKISPGICIADTFPVLEKFVIGDPESPFTGWKPCNTIVHLGVQLEFDETQYPLDFNIRHMWKIQVLFPNLRSLYLEDCNSTVIQFIFQHLQQLVELSLNCIIIDHDVTDSVFTGIGETICKVMDHSKEWNDERISKHLGLEEIHTGESICNMSNLKVLEIKEFNYRDYEPMTDVAGYMAFLRMQPLDKLVISEVSKFSEKCVEQLRELHKNVEISQCRMESNYVSG